MMWFVEFYTDFSDLCLATKPNWVEYSNKYTTKKLKFAEVNIQKLKQLGADYKINDSEFSSK